MSKTINKTLVQDELDRLQYAANESFIFARQLPIGYGGQIAGRITALKLGLALGHKVIFEHKSDPPYLQTVALPFDINDGDLTTAPTMPRFDPLSYQTGDAFVFDHLYAADRLRRRGLIVEQWIDDRLERKWGDAAKWRPLIDGWIFDWLKFLQEYEARAERDRQALGISRQSLGVHFRRGDKSVESAYVPAGVINEAIDDLHRKWAFESLFVASDDPRAAEILCAPEGVRLIFDRDEKRYNNANHKMLLANPDMAAQETYIAFKNLRLLSQCGGIIGQTNAHFPNLVASLMRERDGEGDRIVLIDGWIAERRSVALRAFFNLKRTVRFFAKRVVPKKAVRLLDGLRQRRVRLDSSKR